MEIFAKRLKELRKEQNLSQEKLAAEIKVDKSTIAKYETNKIDPSLEMMLKIAKYFKVPIGYLFGEDD